LIDTSTKSPSIFYIDPLIPKDWIELEKQRLELAYRFWIKEFNPDKIEWIYWLTTDSASIAWAENLYTEKKRGYNKGITIYQGNEQFCNTGTGSNFRTGFAPNRVDNYTIFFCAGVTERDSVKAFKPIHEYTHLVQTKFHGPGNAPDWVVEGMADYYGQALGLLTQPDGEKLLMEHRKGLSFSAHNLDELSQDQFVKYMKTLETPSGYGSNLYYLGGLATEVLVAVYGHDKAVEFTKSFVNMLDILEGPERTPSKFKENFFSVYKMTPDDFYKKLYPYAVAMHKIYNPNHLNPLNRKPIG